MSREEKERNLNFFTSPYLEKFRYVNSSTLATSCEELTHWKGLWCWEGLGAGEGDDRGWDGWMASPTRWTWVWVNSGSWWWTGRPGVLQFMGSQSRTWLSDWSDLIWFREIQICLISFKYHSHNQKTLTVVQDVCCSVASSCPTLHDCGLKLTRLTIFFFLPKFMSIESVMPSNHLILSPSSPSAFNLSQHQGLPMMCK